MSHIIAKYFVSVGWKWGMPSVLKPGTYSYSLKKYKSRESAIRAGKRETGLPLRKPVKFNRPA